MPTVGQLISSLDVQPDRRQVVADVLQQTGYPLDEQAGEAMGLIELQPKEAGLRLENSTLFLQSSSLKVKIC